VNTIPAVESSNLDLILNTPKFGRRGLNAGSTPSHQAHDQCDRKDHEEDVEEQLRDSGSSGSDSRKSKHGRHDGYDQEYQRPIQHREPPSEIGFNFSTKA
jgi:hypothetical protein